MFNKLDGHSTGRKLFVTILLAACLVFGAFYIVLSRSSGSYGYKVLERIGGEEEAAANASYKYQYPFVDKRDAGELDLATIDFWNKLTKEPRELRCPSGNSGCPLEGEKLTSSPPKWENSSERNICPDYFKWIREDLRPWANYNTSEAVRGISREVIEYSILTASFRVAIVGGRLYVEPFKACFQTRALFTVWGLLQLLRYYPGLIPDVELAFSCQDIPSIAKGRYRHRRNGPPPSTPPVVFRYCSNNKFHDIAFPDWSFWGWPDTNIRPWDTELADILRGSKEVAWPNRRNTSYWRGNPYVSAHRRELLKCNSSDYNAEIYIQDWSTEGTHKFHNSRLAQQCKHRYKIYIEGWAWSVSLKYIFACDSPVLLISPRYHDFFTRGLLPKVSYWPVRNNEMCKSIKFGFDWGNVHPVEMERIGKHGQAFISKEVDMGHVYDYMLHMLREYAKLQQFKPRIPEKGVEVCTNSILCSSKDLEKPFLEESLVKGPSVHAPCDLPDDNESPTTWEMLSKANIGVQSVQREEMYAWSNEPS